MRIAADTNVLLRAILDDHPVQSALAQATLRDAELVAISLPTLCEFVWSLRRGYKRTQADVVSTLSALLETSNIVIDRPAVEAGLTLARAGGDFADGVIAFEGRRLGGTHLATFDREAARLISDEGFETLLLRPVS